MRWQQPDARSNRAFRTRDTADLVVIRRIRLLSPAMWNIAATNARRRCPIADSEALAVTPTRSTLFDPAKRTYPIRRADDSL